MRNLHFINNHYMWSCSVEPGHSQAQIPLQNPAVVSELLPATQPPV